MFKFIIGNVQKNHVKEPGFKKIFSNSKNNLTLHSIEPTLKGDFNNGFFYLWGEVYYPLNENISFLNKLQKQKYIEKYLESKNPIDLSIVIEGNFVAFVSKNDYYYIVCDKCNSTEIFYKKSNNGAIITTSIDLIINSINQVEYDQAVLANILSVYGYYSPKKHTIYKDISRLGVGEYCQFDNSSNFKLGKRKFFPIKTREMTVNDNLAYKDILFNAISSRASQSENWLYLSSGWDSSAILSILVELYGKSSVNAVIGHLIYSKRAGVINDIEIARARKLSDYYGVDLDVVPCDLTNDESINYWQELSTTLKKKHYFATSAYNFHRLSDFLNKPTGERSIFSGEISDGAHNFGFAQSASILDHPDNGFRMYADKMSSYLFGPTFFSRIIKGDYGEDTIYKFMVNRFNSLSFGEFDSIDERKKQFFISFFMRNTRIPFVAGNDLGILTDHGYKNYEKEIFDSYLQEAASNATEENLYSWLLNLYSSFYWQGSTVQTIGTGLSDYGEKLKLPFGDTKLLNFLSEMPESWGRGLDLNPTKYPLKFMLENYVDYPIDCQKGPHSYLYDIDPEFSLEKEVLFASKTSEYFKELLSSHPYEEILDEKYFDLKHINYIVDSYTKNTLNEEKYIHELTSILCLCLTGWY